MKKTRVDLDPKGPITFEREVAIPTPTGEALQVCFAFVVRSRVEYAEFVTRRISRMKVFEEPQAEVLKIEAQPERKPELADLAAEANKRAAENILDMARDWGIEGADFTRENVVKFCNLYPGAERAIFDDYQTGSLEGRLGNLPT
ncbi:MAG: hypothetical protein KA265_16695 [Piscinibacter sp.]|jgi:hypothetical protein|nr:hypothetical protein [Piscinibacter sp.]